MENIIFPLAHAFKGQFLEAEFYLPLVNYNSYVMFKTKSSGNLLSKYLCH